jgi:hypothetical protein
MIPRSDQTELYEIRSQVAILSECPPFFLQVKHIKSAFGVTKVWNIYANNKDIESISKELKTAYSKPALRQFFPWKEYQSLRQTQHLTILKLHNTIIVFLFMDSIQTTTTIMLCGTMILTFNKPLTQKVTLQENGNSTAIQTT